MDRLCKVEVIVSPERLVQIRGVLARVGVEGMTISQVRGIGRRAAARRRESGLAGSFVSDLKIEIVLEEGRVPSLLDEIVHTSRTPEGDGKIFVLHVEEAIRIRTRQRGYDAV
jgi:nitrogen regulatory protein P-II 1